MRTLNPLRRFPRIAAALAVLVGLACTVLLGVLAWGLSLTSDPQAEDPRRVDALLVLYSSPQVYDEAIELIEQGRADHVFVSMYLGPDGHEKLCGPEASADPRLASVTIHCFQPDPITTQGEAMYAARKMEELGLDSLGVLAFPQQVERARILAERCWSGPGRSVQMFGFERENQSWWDEVGQNIYGATAYVKVLAAPECDSRAAWLEWPVEKYKQGRQELRIWWNRVSA